jgi:hypothetical protein
MVSDARPVVLILAPGDDIHALAVKEKIARIYGETVRCLIFDTATYPVGSAIEWRSKEAGLAISFKIAKPLAECVGPSAGSVLAARPPNAEGVDVSCITGVWRRRPRSAIVHPDIKEIEYADYCRRVANSCCDAALMALPIYNSLHFEERCSKPFQLFRARRLGMNIPRTLITTDAGEAERFVRDLWKEGRQVVYKHASDASLIAIPTRIFAEGDFERLPSLKIAASTFQERITGGIDLRIVVIGDRIFAAEWRPAVPRSDVIDIRFESNSRMSATECPSSIVGPLLQLHRDLGLVFGVYDFRTDQDGTPYFLEVNPSGQWLDLEIEAGYPISEIWARMLCEGIDYACEPSSPLMTEADLAKLMEPELEQGIPHTWNVVYERA